MFDLERIEIVDEETHFECDPLGVNIVPSNGGIEATRAGDIAYRSMEEISHKAGISIDELMGMVSARAKAETKCKARRESILRKEGRRFA